MELYQQDVAEGTLSVSLTHTHTHTGVSRLSFPSELYFVFCNFFLVENSSKLPSIVSPALVSAELVFNTAE